VCETTNSLSEPPDSAASGVFYFFCARLSFARMAASSARSRRLHLPRCATSGRLRHLVGRRRLQQSFYAGIEHQPAPAHRHCVQPTRPHQVVYLCPTKPGDPAGDVNRHGYGSMHVAFWCSHVCAPVCFLSGNINSAGQNQESSTPSCANVREGSNRPSGGYRAPEASVDQPMQARDDRPHCPGSKTASARGIGKRWSLPGRFPAWILLRGPSRIDQPPTLGTNPPFHAKGACPFQPAAGIAAF
jgi:hypothetical protein